MKRTALTALALALAIPASAEDAAAPAPQQQAGWGWARAVEAASGAWAKVPTRATAAEFATEQGTKILTVGSAATAGALSYAADGAGLAAERWQAVANHVAIEDGVIVGAIMLPTVAGSFYGCTVLTTEVLGPAAPVAGLTCAFGGQRLGEGLTRSAFGAMGRDLPEETLRLGSDASFVAGTLGAGRLASPRAFTWAVREMRRIAPQMLRAAPAVGALAPVAATAAPAASDEPRP